MLDANPHKLRKNTLEQQQKEIDMLKLEVKIIDIKNKMSEAMKTRMIHWAEENPDKANQIGDRNGCNKRFRLFYKH